MKKSSIIIISLTILAIISFIYNFQNKISFSPENAGISTSESSSCLAGFIPTKQCSNEFKPIATFSADDLNEFKCEQSLPLKLTLAIDAGNAGLQVEFPEVNCEGFEYHKSLFQGSQKNLVRNSKNVCGKPASIFENPEKLELLLNHEFAFSGKIPEGKTRDSSLPLFNGNEFSLYTFELPPHENDFVFNKKDFSFDLSSTPPACQLPHINDLGSTLDIFTTRGGTELTGILKKNPATGESEKFFLLEKERDEIRRLLSEGQAISSGTMVFGGKKWAIGYWTVDILVPGNAQWPTAVVHGLSFTTTPGAVFEFIFENKVTESTFETIEQLCSGAKGELAEICKNYLQ